MHVYMHRQNTALILKLYRPGEYWIVCGIFYCHENVKIAQLLPDKVTAWLALSHQDDVTLGVASDGALHFWQPPVVLTSHMDQSRMFHCHCLQQEPLKFHDTKTVITRIYCAWTDCYTALRFDGELLSAIHLSIHNNTSYSFTVNPISSFLGRKHSET